MRKVTVNIVKQTVSVDGQTCNFYEAGLVPNGIAIVDNDEIEEHLLERLGEDAVIVFDHFDHNTRKANTIVNALLAEVLQSHSFNFVERTKYYEVYSLCFDNASNCTGQLFLTTLSDGSLRLSVSSTADSYIDAIDLFEFKAFDKIQAFLELVL
jgi:hypothetical protein